LFLSPSLKKKLAGLTFAQDRFKTKCDGVIRTLTEDEFARIFQKWLERCKKCVCISGEYVQEC
jgi:hypothetical protein